MDRNTLQELAVNRLASEKRLLCQWATGTGKSNVALKFLRANPETTCLILVPEQNNIENWTTEFTKFGVPMELVRVACYASLHKYADTQWGLIVLDEVPHIDTDLKKALCQRIQGEYVLALGAVVDEDELATLEEVYGKFSKSYVSLQKAIEWEILPSPTVFILHMQLDNTYRKYWYKGRPYTAKQMYSIYSDEVSSYADSYAAKPNPRVKQMMYQAGNKRKRFLGKLKDDAIAYVCRRLEKKGRRFICFCSSIKQAEALGGDKAFTSKSPMSMQHLSKFNNHEINSLYVVGKLIEGQNLVDIDCGVIGQIGGTSRITVQEIGRVMRSENPRIYIPVFDDTKDDSFLYTLTSNIPERYIKHYNFK
ncbi:MAG: DEAD/DEAH box helicase family protein [Bacteroidales bacterium]|nr:DEAD/DEAH box helicase family protein [Bacteroidales bacterium]